MSSIELIERPETATIDWEAVKRDLHGLNVIVSPGQRKQLSKDFYWYSPILTEQLAGCVADLVVKVSTEDDVRQAAAVAAKWKLPITVRAGGTGNYGQCVPLEGGLVLDVTQMSRVLEIGDGRVRVQAGARMHDIELAVAETGQALRMWPSTWHVASIGGFIAGGFGGIGSIRHGILRDPGNLLRARVMTVEREPRIIELHGDEIQQVHHAYGTNGVITEVEVALSPTVEWVHCIALFDTYRRVLDFGVAASTPSLELFLLSAVDARFSPYYAMLGSHFPPDKHAMFAMVAPDSMADFRALVEAHGGSISLEGTEAQLHAAGLPPAYECAYNHTTLQALKVDRTWTYLQVAYAQPFDPAVVDRHIAIFGDDVLQHHEFARAGGEYGTFAILLVRWKGEAHQYEVIREIESQGGCQIFNPHVVTIEDGGMKTIDTQQIDFKKRSDPMGLMNPGKTRGWLPEMAREA
ncbi:FAD-binding oxidoreductase [Variovorax sp. Sphag1AA]|uniref:FAD-binding oxidoreductase n=1 Tax=Variovorax sp. Sphag1AA TaxID=2587027 RepID=UPI00161CEB3A|nr:FAD-binding oxidoreductase [Variovorax sp. Sphag1AA]MBB3180547.1 FAD/FMN-containing dehydrogenase [Variovorax sp. Sphag1AA]